MERTIVWEKLSSPRSYSLEKPSPISVYNNHHLRGRFFRTSRKSFEEIHQFMQFRLAAAKAVSTFARSQLTDTTSRMYGQLAAMARDLHNDTSRRAVAEVLYRCVHCNFYSLHASARFL